MEKRKLKVKLRDRTGKEYVKKLRKNGLLPAVLYGPHLKKSLPLEVDMKELRSFLSQSDKAKIITLEITDQKTDKQHNVIIKDSQWDLIKGDLQHLDFYAVTRGETVTTTVPISFVGKSQGEKIGGIVEHLVRELDLECLPKDLPSIIEVDITPLGLGDSLSVGDVKVPSGIKVLTHPQEVVVSVVLPAKEEVKVEEKEAVEEVEVVGKEKEIEETEKEETEKKDEGKE
ncbi:50S ribosomal protein L25/general stress protein Ctc [Candidatus Aerophobetes bacterium Ae_b3b]|nr:MAG: 50S ribosomal protein L25/general stress protein Ctc [Candidatus Aerophobetes bacterium Ae_b3b]